MATTTALTPFSTPVVDKANAIMTEPWQGWVRRVNSQAAQAGDVTHTGTLTINQVILGNGGGDIKALGAYGTLAQVLTSNGAALAPSWQDATIIVAPALVLTNAQIKALPTTDIDVIAAPGAGKRISLIAMDCVLDASAGAYTNIDLDGFLSAYIVDGSSYVDASYLGNDSTLPIADFTSAFGSAQIAHFALSPYMKAEPVNGWGNMPQVHVWTTTPENQPLRLYIDNGGSGDLTGGNAANTLTVRTIYAVLD